MCWITRIPWKIFSLIKWKSNIRLFIQEGRIKVATRKVALRRTIIIVECWMRPKINWMRRTIFELVLVRFVGVGLLIKVGRVDVWVENSMGNITFGAQKWPIGRLGSECSNGVLGRGLSGWNNVKSMEKSVSLKMRRRDPNNKGKTVFVRKAPPRKRHPREWKFNRWVNA